MSPGICRLASLKGGRLPCKVLWNYHSVPSMSAENDWTFLRWPTKRLDPERRQPRRYADIANGEDLSLNYIFERDNLCLFLMLVKCCLKWASGVTGGSNHSDGRTQHALKRQSPQIR